jgi:hypothetical protein
MIIRFSCKLLGKVGQIWLQINTISNLGTCLVAKC